MSYKLYFFFFLAHVFLVSCAQQKKLVTEKGKPIAFPGAEGFGKYTTGGRGGNIFVVSNLNDSGDGSLRNAVESKAPAMILFSVDGTIHLETRLEIKANKTIAGQTAPGDGICIADQPVVIKGDNVIIRYLRFRMGDRYQNKGKIPGAGHDDALNANKKKHIIIDHCSVSWSTDEVLSVYAGDSTSVQWNIMSEPLNYSYHFEKGDTDFEHHGYGGIWGGKHASFHHNLFAHCVSRTPRFDGIRNSPVENVDFRNNVIYNWGHNNVHAGEGGSYNIVNNYYKWGPGTNAKAKCRLLNPFKREDIPYGKFYVAGNYVDDAPEISQQNWLGVEMDKGTKADTVLSKMNQPIAAIAIGTQPAEDAYRSVLQNAGASHRRDTLDSRLINDVKKRTGRFIDVQGGFPHGTEYSLTVNAWPSLKRGTAPADTDADGMPDEWEKKNGLKANDASDAAENKLHRSYTNIEVYINSLLADKTL